MRHTIAFAGKFSATLDLTRKCGMELWLIRIWSGDTLRETVTCWSEEGARLLAWERYTKWLGAQQVLIYEEVAECD